MRYLRDNTAFVEMHKKAVFIFLSVKGFHLRIVETFT